MIDIDRQLEATMNRRIASQNRTENRIIKREALAEKMIGELNSGKFYVFPVNGKYQESTNKYELINFLIRNRYV